jgi:hypothetical protein
MRGLYHTPWSDEVDLLSFADNQDPEGYGTEPVRRRTLFCNWEAGVSQNEFYLSNKQGLQATDSVELQRVDYEGERFAEFEGRRYRVVRSFPASFDTITLILSEVVR